MVQIVNGLMEIISIEFELINWTDSGESIIAVRRAIAPAMLAAMALTSAFGVVRAQVRAKPVLLLIDAAVTCLRNGTDGSDGNCKFHFFELEVYF